MYFCFVKYSNFRIYWRTRLGTITIYYLDFFGADEKFELCINSRSENYYFCFRIVYFQFPCITIKFKSIKIILKITFIIRKENGIICVQSTIQAAGVLLLSKSPPLLNIKRMLTLFVLEHLNLPSSDYLVIHVTFKWAVFMYRLDAKTVENYDFVIVMFLLFVKIAQSVSLKFSNFFTFIVAWRIYSLIFRVLEIPKTVPPLHETGPKNIVLKHSHLMCVCVQPIMIDKTAATRSQ